MIHLNHLRLPLSRILPSGMTPAAEGAVDQEIQAAVVRNQLPNNRHPNPNLNLGCLYHVKIIGNGFVTWDFGKDCKKQKWTQVTSLIRIIKLALLLQLTLLNQLIKQSIGISA